MTATGGARDWNAGLAQPPVPLLRWRRLFGGYERELSAMRRWLSSLLPECPARDDVLTIANELASNAIQHTASGRGGAFEVEVVRYPSVVRVAVADCGSPAEPRVIEDPEGERGRGLLLVRGLSVRTGFAGDRRGRLVWSEISWGDAGAAESTSPQVGYEAAIGEGEAALARRFAAVPTWFGRSTLTWWAVVGSHGLVSAPTAQELAALLCRLLDAFEQARSPLTERVARRAGDEQTQRSQRQTDAGSEKRAGRQRSAGDGRHSGYRSPRSELVSGLAAAASLARA